MNYPTRSINNDNQSGPNKPVKSELDPSRYHRSGSGYPSDFDYVSSSKRHHTEKNPSSSRDHRTRNDASDNQAFSAPLQGRSAYPEPRSARNDASVDHAPKKYGDSSTHRHNHQAEDVPPAQPTKYERWLPSSRPSPPSQQQRLQDKTERARETQRPREEHIRDGRERRKRRPEEGESDWDRDKQRREKDKYERGKADRERAREEYAAERQRGKGERDNVRRSRGDREQEKYTDTERQRADERDREKERDRERRRQEREKEREHEKHKERKDRERTDDKVKTDVEREMERERKRERELARREREHRRDMESGRESDRDPERRRRKGDLEHPKTSALREDVNHEDLRRNTELDETRRMQDPTRRNKTVIIDAGPTPQGGRDQEVERIRLSKKDASASRRKDHGDESEGDRIRFSDKENVSRRDHKSHEKAKRSGGRSYADRATDSERETLPHRDVSAFMRVAVEPETTIAAASRSGVVPNSQAQSRDNKGPPISQAHAPFPLPGNESKPIPSASEVKHATQVDGSVGYNHLMHTSRPIEPSSSITPKDSPISVVSASGESARLDLSGPEVRTKHASSTQRTLKRQSRMLSLAPEQIAILPASHNVNKYNYSQDTSHSQFNVVPPPAPGHASKSGRDTSRFLSSDIPEQINFVSLPKADIPSSAPMTSLNRTTNRGPMRDSVAPLQSHPTHDKRAQPVFNELQGLSEASPPTAKFANPGAEHSNARPVMDAVSASMTSVKASARGSHSLPVSDAPLRRPYSSLGECSQQDRNESSKDRIPDSSTSGPQPYPVGRSVSFDSQQANGTSEIQAATSVRRSVAATESKQESFIPRVHFLAPIPENATVSTSSRPVPHAQVDPQSQQSANPGDKCIPPESSLTFRIASRSVSESAATSAAGTRAKSGKSGRDEIRQSKRAVTEPYHASYSINPEAALRSLTGQHRHEESNYPTEDLVRSEAHPKYSPSALGRREASTQPTHSKSSSTTDAPTVYRPLPSRVHASNHTRSQSSPGKLVDGPLPVTSYSPSLQPSEDKHGRSMQATLERRGDQSDMDVARDQAKHKGTTTSDITYIALPIVPDGKYVTHSQNIGIRSGYDSRHSEHHQDLQRTQQPTNDGRSLDADTARKVYKEGATGKKSQSPNKDHVVLVSREEHDSHRPKLSVSRPMVDNKHIVQHEGLAKLLEQPVRKSGASPTTHATQHSLPQPDPPFSEAESHNRAPRTAIQPLSSLAGHKTPSPILKVLDQKFHANEENSPKTSATHPNESPRYPHSIYRPPPLYPATGNTQSQLPSDHLIYHTPSSHNTPNSNHILPPAPQASQIRDSPTSHQTNVPPPLASRDVREVASGAYNQRPPDVMAPRSSRNQPKERDSVQQNTWPDSSRVPQLKPGPHSQTVEPVDHKPSYTSAEQSVHNSRVGEHSLGTLPTSSLLLSKGMEHLPSRVPLEQKLSGDHRGTSNAYASKEPENVDHSSPAPQDFEPRLNTPQGQKLPELSESHQKAGPLNVAKPRLPELSQEKGAFSDSIKVTSEQPRPPEIWHPPSTSREAHKKGTSTDIGKPSHAQSRPPEIWYPPFSSQADARRRHVPSIASSIYPERPNIGAMLPLDEEVEQAKLAAKATNTGEMKIYRYLREKRNRTLSALSIEAQDGTATSTIMGSPTASILSQPPIQIPSPRDPVMAAYEWSVENREAAKRGKPTGKRRILRPGVVFDVGEDPPPAERRHRSKASRSKVQSNKGT